MLHITFRVHPSRLHKLHAGSFQPDIFEMLQNESKSIPESRRYVILLLDEMKIKENIVYNKHTSEIVGFVSLGDINNSILDLQRDMDKVFKSIGKIGRKASQKHTLI